MRVVLDTNILVSALLVRTGIPARIIERSEQFELLSTNEILAELERVLHYPRIQRKYGLTEQVIADFVQRLRDASLMVAVEETAARVLRDPKDEMFLACAVAGSADYIVSGDADLLVMENFHGIAIVPPAVFLTLLQP